jgi:hypothetical protein
MSNTSAPLAAPTVAVDPRSLPSVLASIWILLPKDQGEDGMDIEGGDAACDSIRGIGGVGACKGGMEGGPIGGGRAGGCNGGDG